MEKIKKEFILPNSGKIYTINELEKIHYILERKSTIKLFKKMVRFDLPDEKDIKHPEIKTNCISFN